MPKGRPAVARLDAVCAATLRHGRAIACAPRLAAIRLSSQRIRAKPDRLLAAQRDLGR